jgi:BirA family biotin operon repressor/biotin-[acetyl-CoA-carboxylase] ligase
MYPDPFTAADLADLSTTTFIDEVDYHDEIESTNTRAAEFAAVSSPTERSTLLVLADHQTAGRGRGTNQWWSAPGALTFSVLLRNPQFTLPKHRWPLVALTTGLAACRAIDQCLHFLYPRPQVQVPSPQIKWPNDVYLGDRKLGGILVEAATGQQGSIIVGIGLNINNSVLAAPPELREKATALCDAAGREVPRIDVLTVLLRELADGLKELKSGGTHWQTEFAARSLLTGRKVEIELPAGPIEGICEGIDQDGALVVATPAGQEHIVSGTVTRFE